MKNSNARLPHTLLVVIICLLLPLLANTAQLFAQVTVTQLLPTNGSRGTSMTIYGAGFDTTYSDNTVTFTLATGGTGSTATVTAGTANQLTVTVPNITGGNYILSVQRASDSTTATAIELFAVTTGGGGFGASGSSDHVVSTSVNGAQSVYAGDVDGDGDLDLISGSPLDEKIVWYENDGTVDPTFTERTVSSSANDVRSVYAGDVDGDGDLDIMSAASFTSNGEIAWYENDGAADPTFAKHIVTTNINRARSVFAADVDDDGDLDLMSASVNDDKIAWYENDGAADPTFTERVVSTNADGAWSVHAADVDDDGDLDLMSACISDDKIAWYENDAAADSMFTERVVSTNADGASSVYAGDVDGDGDLDLLSSALNDDKIAWYENDGAADPTFTEHVVSTAANGVYSVYAGDVDGDGDLDLMSASQNDDKIAWYENDGTVDPTFIKRVVSTNADGAYSVYAGDVDGDGDLDLMSASQNDDKIVWYENTTSFNIAGRALTLDGTNDFLSIPGVVEDLGADPDFTFEVWVKPDMDNQTEGTGILLARNSSTAANVLLIGIENTASSESKQLRVFDQNSGNWELSGTELSNDIWHHVAYTLNSGTGTLFLDGEQIGQHNLDISLSADDTLSIGQEFDTGFTTGNFLLADIDEVRFWDVALTQAQIQQNMFQALNGDETNLIGYYSLNEESGFDANDGTSNSYHGTTYGSPGRSTDTHPYGTFVTGDEGWRMMTSPTGNTSYGTLLEDFWTQGFTGADVTNGVSNVYTWSESDQEFQSIADADDKPSAGTGFLVYVYDDQDNDDSGDGFPKTIRVDNDQNEGAISPTISYTNAGVADSIGWNLIGNPYGATIDWDAASGLTSSNLDAAFYVWSDSANGGTGAYLSWNGVTGTLGDGLIAPWQGFWVKANATGPSLSLNDTVRSAGGVFLKQKPISQLSFSLKGEVLSSKAILMFDDRATSEKDVFDAYKLQPLNQEYLSLFTRLPVPSGEDGSGLDINALPLAVEESLSIPLEIAGSDLSGEFELSWNPEHLPAEMDIVLMDTETNTEINLSEASSYSFELETAPKTKAVKTQELASPQHNVFSPNVMKAKANGSRFIIEINAATSVSNQPGTELPTAVELAQNYPNPFNPATTIQFALPGAGDVRLEVFNLLGQIVATLANEHRAAGTHTIRFDASRLASGIYIYRLHVRRSLAAGGRAGTTITKKLTLIK